MKKIKLVDIAEQIVFWLFIVAACKISKTDPANAFIILGIDINGEIYGI